MVGSIKDNTMNKQQCDRCGLEVDSNNVGDVCEESMCPITVYNTNYEELNFSKEDGASKYIPDIIPDYSDPD